MLLSSVISFLLTFGGPAEGAAGVPVSVEYTPTYAAVDSIATEAGNGMLGGMWVPAEAGTKAETKNGSIHFRWNKYRYEASYMDNAEAAARVRQMIQEIGVEHIDSVIVTSYASPEGVYEHNQKLCRQRAKEFDKVVKKELGLSADGLKLIVRPGGEAWALLMERIESDPNISKVAQERILKLLDNDKIGWDTKKWRMENGWLGHTQKEGDLYRWLLAKHYRYLRSLAVDIYVSNALVAIDGRAVDVVPEEPTLEQVDTAAVQPADSTVLVFEEPVVLTDEVPEEGVVVGSKHTFEPLERLAEIVLRPFLLSCDRLCELASRHIPQVEELPAAVEEPVEETKAEEPALPFWPILGVGTNLLYDLTYIPNYGLTSIPSGTIEYYPESGKYTIGADVEWPNWKHAAEHRYFQIHNVSLWGRYYFKPEQYRFNGWYVGGSANVAGFGVGYNRKGWSGEGLGISALGGHKWTFGRIYIDAGLSLGVFYSRFDSYTWGNDATGWYYYDYVGDPDEFEPRMKRWLWVGPTRVQVTVGIDLFNRNRIKK